MFPEPLESFRTFCKVSGHSGKFPDSMHFFWNCNLESFCASKYVIWKVFVFSVSGLLLGGDEGRGEVAPADSFSSPGTQTAPSGKSLVAVILVQNLLPRRVWARCRLLPRLARQTMPNHLGADSLAQTCLG